MWTMLDSPSRYFITLPLALTSRPWIHNPLVVPLPFIFIPLPLPQVWDVASGDSTPVGAGPAAFDTVRWSPCGNYVFAGEWG